MLRAQQIIQRRGAVFDSDGNDSEYSSTVTDSTIPMGGSASEEEPDDNMQVIFMQNDIDDEQING